MLLLLTDPLVELALPLEAQSLPPETPCVPVARRALARESERLCSSRPVWAPARAVAMACQDMRAEPASAAEHMPPVCAVVVVVALTVEEDLLVDEPLRPGVAAVSTVAAVAAAAAVAVKVAVLVVAV